MAAAPYSNLNLPSNRAIPQNMIRPQRSQSQLDEGYSEETRSQSDNDMMLGESGIVVDDEDAVGKPDEALGMNVRVQDLLELIMGLSLSERKLLAEETVKSLPNAEKETIKALIERLTHFDPVSYLPTEVFLHIFSYLSPKDLLTASCISRAWRIRAQDEKTWRACFAREGWMLDQNKIESVEKLAARRGKPFVMERILGKPDTGLERRGSRKRARDEAFNSEGETGAANVARTTMPLDGDDGDDESSDNMEGVEAAPGGSTTQVPQTSGHDRPQSSISSAIPLHDPLLTTPADLIIHPSAFQPETHHKSPPKISWPYLYKQRRRLEANWEKGLYKMFQIPHPEHQDEGHEECVYTIQHTPRHLVSGSRDKTIRIWDLNTCRLMGEPLQGHEASVLCLQFDERPEHDLIVSGGSDSHVIIWRFSTGEILQYLRQAHEESVLNLRFDDRYIVTCSKDKTIRVWSRQTLARDSPVVPAYRLEHFNEPTCDTALLEPYTLLTTLYGHHAAVNAVQIHNTTIVSASGDRTIKSFDLHTGAQKKTYAGHTKGIACVQFDGRRVVSGSSDNTVRIFDADSTAEVACLQGHANLVRTVQARFGDLDIVSDDELAREANIADRHFLRALAGGMQPASASRSALRNAGSSRPEDMLATGTKIPPGGGGSKWAKIVSGSYDETVILWKRDREQEGRWVPRLRLHQDMLLRGSRRRHVQASMLPLPANLHNINAQVGPGPAAGQGHGHAHMPNANAAQNAAIQQAAAVNQILQQQTTQTQTQTQTQHTHQPQPQHAHPNTTTTTTHQQQNAQHPQQLQPNTTNPPPAAGGPAVPQAPNPLLHAQALAVAAAAAANPPPNRDSNRVFKLQFDARRIICCSQNRVIVGWDFANGERDLEWIGGVSLETA